MKKALQIAVRKGPKVKHYLENITINAKCQ